jgi:hypothetical protein
VQVLFSEAIINLHCRAINHDLSKLQEPEKSMFDHFTPLLRDTEYGTDEYKRILDEMQQTAQQSPPGALPGRHTRHVIVRCVGDVH